MSDITVKKLLESAELQ